MTTTTRTTTPATLAVTLGHDTADQLTADAHTLAGAYLGHSLGDGGATAPSSRQLRGRYLPEWSRTRYAAAVRSLIDHGHHTVTQRPDGTHHLHVTTPADQPARLLAGYPVRADRDLIRLRIWTDAHGVADHRAFLADLDALGPIRHGQRLVLDLGEATRPHEWIVGSVRDAIAAGRLPRRYVLDSRSPEVASAWRRAIDGEG